MKTQYRKYVDDWRKDSPGNFYYTLVSKGYYRRIRTISELRRRAADDVDFPHVSYIDTGRNRGRNTKMLDAWNDFPRARCRNNPRSWKDYTKHKKQWMVGNDPAPIRMPVMNKWGFLVQWGLEHDG